MSRLRRTFLQNQAQHLLSIDFFTVPTLRLQVRYVFLVLAHDRHRILHFNVTAHPTVLFAAASSAQGGSDVRRRSGHIPDRDSRRSIRRLSGFRPDET
jgi:hypothetical protein